MAHRAETILAAVETALTSLTTTGSNVQRDQVTPVANVPAISVELGSDEVLDGSDANMAFLDSLLNVQVVAYVKNSTGLSTQLNQIRKEVHVALYADRTLGLGYVIDTGYVSASEVSKSGDVEQEAAQQIFNYLVHYRHSVTDPSQ